MINLKKQKQPKRHHFLPQFYLRAFCNSNGFLWIYDREKKEYRKQTPKNIALKKQYYTIKISNSNQDTEIENYLSRIENKTKSIINKIENNNKITSEEKGIIALFISLLKVRVPNYEDFINELGEKSIKNLFNFIFSSEERGDRLIEKFEKETGEKINKKEFLAIIERSGIHFHRNFSLALILSHSPKIANILYQMDWVFARVPENKAFVTSDNPFILVPPRNYSFNSDLGVGIKTKGAKKTIPLSNKICLIIGDFGSKVIYQYIPDNFIDVINISIAGCCDRFLIADNKILLEKLINITKINELKKEPMVLMKKIKLHNNGMHSDLA